MSEFSLSIGLFCRVVNRSEPGAPFTYAKRRHIVGGSRGPSGAPHTRGLPDNTVTTRVSGIETIIGSANDPGLRDDQTRVWVGKNYIEVDVGPGADVPIYEMDAYLRDRLRLVFLNRRLDDTFQRQRHADEADADLRKA